MTDPVGLFYVALVPVVLAWMAAELWSITRGGR